MKQIIQIDGNNVFIGTETNEIITATLKSVNYENPQVGDAVEIYKNGDTVLVMKSDDIEDKSPNTAVITKPKKKKWVVIGIVLVILFLFIGIGSCSGGETYDWPDSEMANMLPEPEGKITSLSESNNEKLSATVEINDDYCKTYIDECIEKGFNVDQDISSNDGRYDYTAKNESGWEIDVSNYNGEMDIDLYSPEWLAGLEGDTTEESTKEETTSSSENLVDGMRPEFKEAMDSYEAFYDEYCDFMEEYAANPSDLGLISEYSEIVSKASDMDKKFEKWDDEDLNDAELQYYLEVSERISKKLLEVSESM